ncbi:aminotransferase class V-fold PLP-dependent enzyme, partial [uncultured Helicobacter sp.]|uniref:aminotransferase class V-fold PLP-dependent enzyme n=1 Tax=uncultured Helicobacter sp. TaxID=175537 RepID=UPI0025EEF857
MQIYKKRHYDKLLDCLFAPLLGDGDLLTQLRANTILAKGQRYFDFTASGLAYKKIEKRIDSILPYYANTHSRFATHSAFMSVIYEGAKERLKEMLGLDDEFVLIAGGSGASFGIKKFQELMGIYMSPKSLAHFGLFFQGIEGLNDEKNCASQNPLLEKLRIYDRQTKTLNLPCVLLSGFEHHSNEISFREGLCHIHKIGFDKAGLPDVGYLKKILQNLKDEKIIASLSVASNVTGLLAPIESYSKLLRENKATIAFDMASSSSYMQVDSYLYDAGFFAPHKL